MTNIKLAGATVVIVGASSGLGRLAAMRFAERGANLVLAARNREAIETVALAARRRGVAAVAVPTDVTEPDDIERLVKSALEFGRTIDVWINNAGSGAVGSFVETPREAHERVIATNLLGPIRCIRAVLPVFVRQGHGVLINTNSIGAWAPAPYAAAYTASKFGLRGLSEALRGELRSFSDIHVCDVYPSFMNTPGLRHAANYTGRSLKTPPGVTDPERAARAMVELAERPRPVRKVGLQTRLARLAHCVAPNLMATVTAQTYETWRSLAAPAPLTSGNLFEPSRQWLTVTGAWRSPKQRLGVAVGAALLLGGIAIGGAILAHRR